MAEFRVGDIVRLKSGGPQMTVAKNIPNASDGPSVNCVWFVGDEPKEKWFVIGSVEPVIKDD